MVMAKKNILIVDDSLSIREIVRMSLEDEDYIVHVGVDGKDALKFFDGKRFDLIITDLHMPNLDGFGLIREIRAREEYKYVPVLFLTTETNNELKLKAKKEGATGWLQKPFDVDKLKRTVNKLIR
jgi:two-component system chemotaxis response regulator CheY